MVAALPTIILGSIIVKIMVLVATIPAIVLPWYLAHRARWMQGRTTRTFLSAAAGQLLICFAAWMAISFTTDLIGLGEIGIIAVALCILALVAAIALQLVFLMARWGFARLAKLRLQRQSPGDGN